MSDETYNGWTGKGNKASAYATWRVALEMFDGYEVAESFTDGKPTRNNLADWLREQVDDYVDEYMTEESAGGMIRGWVDAFLDDVNWEEIAENILSDWDD
jgi:hypothetical protein